MKAAEFPPDDFRNMDTWRIFRIIDRQIKLTGFRCGKAEILPGTPLHRRA